MNPEVSQFINQAVDGIIDAVKNGVASSSQLEISSSKPLPIVVYIDAKEAGLAACVQGTTANNAIAATATTHSAGQLKAEIMRWIAPHLASEHRVFVTLSGRASDAGDYIRAASGNSQDGTLSPMDSALVDFVESGVKRAVRELSDKKANTAELKFESDKQFVWIVASDRSTESETVYTAKTLDQDSLVGVGPTFFIKENDSEHLIAGICAFLSKHLIRAKTLSAELYTGYGLLTELTMKGDHTIGALEPVEQKEEPIRWEPMGPLGFGC